METKEKSKETAKEYLRLSFALANLELDIADSKTDKKKLAKLNKKLDLLDKLIKLVRKMNKRPEKKNDEMYRYVNSIFIGLCQRMKKEVKGEIKSISTKPSLRFKDFEIPNMPDVDFQI